MRARRQFVLAVTAVLAGLALSACDPWPVPDRTDEAWVDVDIEPDGGASARVFIAYALRDQLQQVGRELAPALFPGRETIAEINQNDGGAPFIVIQTRDAYEPGTHPSFAMKSPQLYRALSAHGMMNVRLTVCPPAVPATLAARPPPQPLSGCWQWELRPQEADATMSISLHPSPGRWWAELSLLVASFAAVVLLWLALRGLWPHPHRLLVILIGLVGLTAAGVGIMSAAGVQGDNLGVAGILHGKVRGGDRRSCTDPAFCRRHDCVAGHLHFGTTASRAEPVRGDFDEGPVDVALFETERSQ
jgi:hypothetical protein